MLPDAVPGRHPPEEVTTATTSLVPPPEIRTWYPAPLVVSMPTGQGVRVIVAGEPPVSGLVMP